MSELANCRIFAEFRHHIFAILDIYAEIINTPMKAAIAKTKINMSGDALIRNTHPYVIEFMPYIDSGDLVGFAKSEQLALGAYTPIRKFSKLIAVLYSEQHAHHIPAVLRHMREIKDACLAYVMT